MSDGRMRHARKSQHLEAPPTNVLNPSGSGNEVRLNLEASLPMQSLDAEVCLYVFFVGDGRSPGGRRDRCEDGSRGKRRRREEGEGRPVAS